MFSTVFRQKGNLSGNQKCQAGFRPLCNKIPLSEKEFCVFFQKLRSSKPNVLTLIPQHQLIWAVFKGNQPFVKFSVAVRMTEHYERQSQSENFTTPLRSSRLLKKGDEAKFHLEKP